MSEPFGFTALTSFGPLATKSFKIDPLTGELAVDGYGNAKDFKLRPVTFSDLADFCGKLGHLRSEPKTYIVRGAPREGVDLSRARRLLHPDTKGKTTTPPTLEPCDRAWIGLDVDKLVFPDGLDPVKDPAAALSFLLPALPPEFDEVDVVVSWGSSMGIKPGKFSAHVFALLDRAYSDAELTRWGKQARAHLPGLDVAVFRPAQPFYTAAPRCIGFPDPFAENRITLITRSKRTAALVIPDAATVAASDRTKGMSHCAGYEAHRDRIGTADGFHEPILAAIGAYVKQNGSRGTDPAALAADIRAAILEADPGGRDEEQIARYASDDFLSDKIRYCIEHDPAARPAQPASTGPYDEQRGRIVYKRERPDGFLDVVPLCNWTGRIVEERVVDDGATAEMNFIIKGTLDNGRPLPPAEVPAAQFQGMSWTTKFWGSDAVIYSGRDGRDRIRDAIQRFSMEGKARRTIFKHSGWRKVGGEWVFLHGEGAVGASGTRDDVEVHLEAGLAAAVLPDIPDDLPDAVRATLAAWTFGPDRITLPVLAAVFRAPLCEVARAVFSLFLVGSTGVFKTEIATLAQRFSGPFTAHSLPGNFSSTANALEKLTFLGKDNLLVLDEYTPKGSSSRQVAEMHDKGERIFRAVGNVAPRGRLTDTTAMRSGFTPRGLVVATGEDLPLGQSLLARLVVLEVNAGDVSPRKLSFAQDAASGFPGVMAGYLRWLAPRIDDLKKTARKHLDALRDRATEGTTHARTPDSAASLYYGMEMFLSFAQDVGALTAPDAAALADRTWKALLSVAGAQAAHLRAADPVVRFDSLLSAVFASQQAHLLDADTGGAPANPAAWGWRLESDGNGGHLARPQGPPLGYVNPDGALLLDPENVYSLIQQLAARQGGSFPVSAHGLWKRLDDRRRLVREPGSETRTVRFKPPLGSPRRRFIHLLPAPEPPSSSESGSGGGSGIPVQTVHGTGTRTVIGPSAHPEPEIPVHGPVHGSKTCPEPVPAPTGTGPGSAPKPVHSGKACPESAPTRKINPLSGNDLPSPGQLGQVGQVFPGGGPPPADDAEEVA